MATRFGNFKELSQGKKPITADEAYLMLKELGMLGNQFIPGAESLGMLLDGKSPKEAAMALQEWIPGNAAYQNWLNDRPQDWSRNAVDAAVMAVPAARGATKAAGAIERTFGGKLGPREGFLNVMPVKNSQGQNYLVRATSDEELDLLNKSVDIAKNKKIISSEDADKLKNNLQSTYNNYLYKEKLINNGLINPNSVKKKSTLKEITKNDIKEKSYNDYDVAKELGEKYKVNVKPYGKSLQGDKYYTSYDTGLPMLYSEDMTDATIGRHDLTNYNEILPLVNEEARKLLPGKNNRIKQIFGKGQKELNTYKNVIEPAMFEDINILNNTNASRNSIAAGKEQTKKLENYISPNDFYKIILGL